MALAALGVAGCGDDPTAADERGDQIGDAAGEAGLPADVAGLLADAARSDGTYRVVFEAAAGDAAPTRVTLTQRPPDRRIDIEQADGTAQSTIGTATDNHRCTREGADGAWTCEALVEPSPDGVFQEAIVDALTDTLTEQAASYDFAVETRTVLERDVRCLVTTLHEGIDDPSLGGSGTLCISAEGAMVLVETPSQTIRAIGYSTDVADDAFALPS